MFGKKKGIKEKEVSITMVVAAETKKELERAAKNLRALTAKLAEERAKNVSLSAELDTSKARVKELEGGQAAVKPAADDLSKANAEAEAAVHPA